MKLRLTPLLAIAAALALPLSAQASIYQFNALINSASEVPTNSSTANGAATLFYNDKATATPADDSFDFSMSVFGLTGPITGAHIHAPAAVGVNAPVVVALNVAPFVLLNSGSSLLIGGSDVATPYVSFLSQLQSGLTYVNVHSALFPGGEVRGQLFEVSVVPEPSSMVLLLAGLGFTGLLMTSRSRRQR